MSDPNARSRPRTAKPPLPVWIGQPSACDTSRPVGPVMKQEKSCDWKIGLRAVRSITQPICWETWSSRFWTRARRTGSSAMARLQRREVDQEVVAVVDLKLVAGTDEDRRRRLLDHERSGEPVAGLEVGAGGDRTGLA